MKKITILIYLTLFINLLNAQTITEFSSGYTSLEGIAINSNNEVYISEHDSGKIYKLDSSGNKTFIATAGGYANDMVFDTNDNLYVAEPFTNKISVIDNTTGVMSEYISTFSIGNSPYGIEYYGGLIYFASETSAKVIQINSDLSTSDYATDFFTPEGIAFDSDGNLYVADRNDRKLFKITPTGVKTTIASNIKNIRGVTVSPTNIVYFTMQNNFPLENKIMKYDPTTGNVSDFVTTNLDKPRSIEIDNLGNMYVTNIGNGTVTKISDNSLLPTIVNIPDANFKAELINNSAINTNGDNEIHITEANAFSGTINVANKNISDLTGIEYFSHIKELNCSSNNLIALNTSGNTTLETLICLNNRIRTLDLSTNTNLKYLDCQRNIFLSVLDITANIGIEYLDCSSNDLTSLDTSNNHNLTYLTCSQNEISALDLSLNTSLTNLFLTNNSLSTLDISTNTNLKYFSCAGNMLSTIDLSSNTSLINFYCWGNSFSILNVSVNTNLVELGCSDNLLSTLNLSNNTKLQTLYCDDNELTNLDLSNNTLLVQLICRSNKLIVLDVSSHPNIINLDCQSNSELTTIDFRNGNNSLLSDTNFFASNNPNLTCIYVDDLTYSNNNWSNIDSTSTFVETEAECSALSIDEFLLVDFKVYPNPTSTILNINIPFKKAIIYNIQGKELMKSNSQNINIENLSKGLYLIQLEDQNNNIYSTNFIKE